MNLEHEDKWLQQLKARLDDHETPPDDQLWEALVARMAQPKPMPVKPRLRVYYILSGVAAAVIAFLFLLPIFNKGNRNEVKDNGNIVAISTEPLPKGKETMPCADEPIQANTTASSDVINVKSEDLKDYTPTGKRDNRSGARVHPKTTLEQSETRSSANRQHFDQSISKAETNIADKLTSTLTEGHEDEALIASAQTATPTVQEAQPAVDKRQETLTAAERWAMNTPQPSSRDTREVQKALAKQAGSFRERIDRWSMRTYAGNVAYASTALSPMSINDLFSISSSGKEEYLSWDKPVLMLRSSYDDNTIDLDDASFSHSSPFSVGATFVRNIGKGMFVGSGLFYSMHRSTFSTTHRGYDLTGKQLISFLGVPLQVGYNLYQNDRFRLYAFADGSLEIPLQRKVRINGNISDIRLTNSEIVRKEKLQFAIGAGAGAEVRINNFIGFYAEPELHYYINNNSGINTIYKQSPLNVNLNFGLRFVLD